MGCLGLNENEVLTKHPLKQYLHKAAGREQIASWCYSEYYYMSQCQSFLVIIENHRIVGQKTYWDESLPSLFNSLKKKASSFTAKGFYVTYPIGKVYFEWQLDEGTPCVFASLY